MVSGVERSDRRKVNQWGRGRLARRARCFRSIRILWPEQGSEAVWSVATKMKKPRVSLTHSPRPAVRYRPLPTCFLCQASFDTPQSAIFNQLALKLGLRAHHQPGKSVNASGLLFWPRTSWVLLNQQFAIDPYRPSRCLQPAHGPFSLFPAIMVFRAGPRNRDLAWIPVLAANRENVWDVKERVWIYASRARSQSKLRDYNVRKISNLQPIHKPVLWKWCTTLPKYSKNAVKSVIFENFRMWKFAEKPVFMRQKYRWQIAIGN